MQFSHEEEFARQMDRDDELRLFRDRFHVPLGGNGEPLIYFAGNSLGLMPKGARAIVEQELDQWATRAVDAHHAADAPWYSYHEALRQPLARLAGAQPHEVVAMNSLTVNLHLMLATFYRPDKSRFKILMEAPAFPSDTYAIKSQIAHHGLDAKEALVLVASDDFNVAAEQLEAAMDEHADELAIVVIGALNFFSGQLFDVPRIAAAAHRHGITFGVDLAHAIGNVPLALHDWDVDFAVWCSYKYLNAGPGAIGGAFVHERHARDTELPRLAGWWGNDPATRFRMHLQPEFVPVQSADAWSLSNPPILSMAPLRASLEIFDAAGGMQKLREKSRKLTAYFEFLITQFGSEHFGVITPRDPEQRGCQLSILAHDTPRALFAKLEAAGVKCDFREPNVIRAAPTPLYNTFHEVWRFAQVLRAA